MNNSHPVNTVITNFNAVLPDCILANSVLSIKNDRIADICQVKDFSGDSSTFTEKPLLVDFCGDIMIPGLIDLHVHGCGGWDAMDASPGALGNMAEALLRQGTTAFLATTMTSPSSRLMAALAAGATFRADGHQAELLGFHMEGPCISPAFRGAQNMSEMEEVQVPFTAAGGNGDIGRVRILTLAPEMPEARKYMDRAKAAGIILSAGHSGASYEQMLAAIDDGVHYVTHAFNAMPGIHHRAPGLLSAALLDPRVTIELIADGIHVHPAVLELAARLKGRDRIVLVSDGTRAVGMPDGEYDLGGRQVQLFQGKMTLPDGTIAGSASPLLAGVRFMTKVVGRPLHESVRMASLNPARLMNIDSYCGSLKPNSAATFLRLSPDLVLKEVWVKGRCRYSIQ